MGTGSHITMKSIADELGVSVTTVARALKGGERISADMVRKVNDTADRLGYVRNLDAVKLRTGQTFVIMAFLSFTSDEEVGDSGSVGLLNGIHQRLAGTEYSVRATPVTMEENGLEELRKVVNGRNADGLILDHTTPDDERVRFLIEEGIPFVTFGRTDMSASHAYFDLDNAFVAYQGTRVLLDRGFHRIALLDADLRYSFTGQRVQGYRTALDEAGLAVDEEMIAHIEMDPILASKASFDLVQKGADAIVCVNELTLLGARAGVRRALGSEAEGFGYSVRSGTNLGAYLGSEVANVYFSRLEAGRMLTEILMKRMAGAPLGECQVIERTRLREG